MKIPKELFKRVEDHIDILNLKVGMRLYKYPVEGGIEKFMDIHENKHVGMIIKRITVDEVALVTENGGEKETEVQETFLGLIKSGKWWYEKDL
ncbi:MAG TPA: hypothetical protein VGO09_10770 [Flavisolibacter sp.]|nr:hypothetical protein [Flavisolibacter sp.]